MEPRKDVFHAIADPTRREIMELIAGKPQNLNAISKNFDFSRQAVSLHIKILTECGLIQIKQIGRERFCAPNLEKLSEVSDWIDRYRQHFEDKLDALDIYLQTLQNERANGKRKK